MLFLYQTKLTRLRNDNRNLTPLLIRGGKRERERGKNGSYFTSSFDGELNVAKLIPDGKYQLYRTVRTHE